MKAASARGAPPAAAPSPLAALREAATHCRECPIGYNGTRMVWGEGAPHGRLMLVGEQPGDQEEQQGRPFVGPAGRLLDQALAQLGWAREGLYVTNAVKHFKFELRGKRRMHKTPGQREVLACAGHWLEDEIAAVQPEAAIALGGTAARALLRRPVAVLSERGRWQQREADGLPVLVTLHPSALLRLRGAAERKAAFDGWLHDLALAAGFVAPA